MLTPKLLIELKKILPEKVFTSTEVLQKHAGNLFYINNGLPDAVCYVTSEEDVIKVTNFCLHHKIPLIPYGSGTSVEGHIAATNGGICVDLSEMNQVIAFSPQDGYVIVEPGIPYNKLNEYLDPYGFHFPVEAGWGASIGGMVATNASGAGATDAGSMAKNVVGCSVIVCKDGKASKIKTGTKSPKSSAGYNLTNLFIGSEGTLGVFTQITLKVRKNFSYHNTVTCQFDDILQAVNFVVSMKGFVQFRRVELLDKLQTEACVSFSGVSYLDPNKITIIMELAGNELAVREEVKLLIEFLKNNHGINIKIFNDKKSAEFIWMMRKNACPAAIQFINKNKKAMATDISVPLSKLAECIDACYEHMERIGLKAPLVAHVGDGNFHFTILVNPDSEHDLKKALEFNKRIVEEALRRGGTCTGEHGIGLGKKAFLESEHGDSLFVMKLIKEALDPLKIFNPGKIIDVDRKLHYSHESEIKETSLSSSCMFAPSPMLRSKI